MSVAPVLTPVTTPAMVTVATPLSVDCHVACDVIACVVAFERLAVAVNCAVEPTVGAMPVTVTDETVGAAGAEVAPELGDEPLEPLLQAQTVSPSAPAPIARTAYRRIFCHLCC
jgi:hypothetical protein